MKFYLDTTDNKAVSSLPETTFYTVKNADFLSLCKDLDTLNYKEDDIFIINAEMKTGIDQKHSDFGGILLLKWLRIHKKLTNKIIVFGILLLPSIMASHPEHIILMAPATSYLQFPFSEELLNKTISDTKPVEKGKFTALYRPFVKADFNIEQIGHSFANEFGLFLMQIIHNQITAKEISPKNISTYGNLDFDKAFFLYSPKTIIGDMSHISNVKKSLQEVVGQPESKILYIDDQASLGWDKLLCDMIFESETSQKFVVLSQTKDFTIKQVSKSINREKPGCVLLDLRLQGDTERDLPIDEISGYRLLLAIKKKFPALPVIFVSATNKADNLRALIKARAEGLWIKPRVEFYHSPSYFPDSYLNLLQLVFDSLTKYKTPLEKTIFKLDFQEEQLKPDYSKDVFFSRSLFIFETNYFICSNQKYSAYYEGLYHFILLNYNFKLANKKKRIIISQDVLLELFVLSSKKLSPPDTTEKYDTKVSSRYALDLILRNLNSGSNVIDTAFDLGQRLKSATIS